MLMSKKSAPGNLTRSRTVVAMIAATLLLAGGTATGVSAKSRNHHHDASHHHHHAHYARNGVVGASADLVFMRARFASQRLGGLL